MTYRLVIDTNVLISAVFRAGNPKLVLQSAKNNQTVLLTSPQIASEVKRVLNYPKFKRYYLDIKRTPDEVYTEYIRITEMVTPATKLDASELRDASDTIILACAVGGKADFIITGDDDLLTLNTYQNIRILTPAQFLALLHPPGDPPTPDR